ncbi:Ribosome biogenesis protein NEP1-like, putative [Fagus crenata]|uniref:Transmembrane protein n=1 Tax=Fagus sylvatica TaxID=28930 RepID=A0A2N9HYF2_FAGSY
MAFRANSYWKSMLTRLGGNRSFASSTTPKMKPFAPTIDAAHADRHRSKLAMRGEFAPIFVVLGMLMVAMTIGAHTAKQHLMHSPGVRVSKKKRESFPEVEDPDNVISSADKFVNKSFLRKVAHIQDHKRVIPDPTRPNPFTRPRHAETLKSVGVDPARH